MKNHFLKLFFTTLFVFTSLVCSAQKYIFDFPFRSVVDDEKLVSEEIKSDDNNAYRVEWTINGQNSIVVKLSEVKIDINGIAKIVKHIETINLTPSILTLFDSGNSFAISSSTTPYFYMFEKGGIRVKGLSGYTLTIFDTWLGMYLYTMKDGKQWETRTEEYYKKEYNSLLQKIKTLAWNSVRKE